MGEPSKSSAEVLLSELGWVRTLARSLVRDSATAEDIVQDACLALLSAGPDSIEKPRGFLRAVLYNLARARARSDIARRQREPAAARHGEIAAPDELALRMEQHRRLAEAVLALDEPFRSTIVLRYLDGLEPSEIARRQGVPAGTVRRRLKTGLERLRERLDGTFDGGRAAWAVALLPMLDLRSAWTWEILGSKSALVAGALVMKKTLIAACVLVVGATLVAVSVWPDETERQEGASAAVADVAPAHGAIESGATELADSRDVSGRGAGNSTPLAHAASGSRITGRVRIPPGCALDDTLEVLALDRPLEYLEIARLIDEANAAQSLVARASVDASGEFAIDVDPERAATAHLAVRGRTLYTAETQPIPLAARANFVELTPRVGANLRVQLSAPGAELGGIPLRLGGSAAEMTPAAGILGRGHSLDVCVSADGSFEFRALPLDHSYQVFVLPEALAAQKSELAGLVGCTSREITLSLTPGARVFGRVVGHDGRPVAGADVEALLPGRWLGLDDRGARLTQTDADGKFELVAVPTGAVNLLARKNGALESEKLAVQTVEGGFLRDIELALGEGETIRGRVTPALSGVQVTAEFDVAFLANETAVNARRGRFASAETDADGRFALTGLGPGPFTVRAVATLADGTIARARQDGVRPAADVDLVLHAPTALRGTVRNARGDPVVSFDVEAVRVVTGALGPMGMTRERRHVDDAQGRFALEDLDSGTWIVGATSSNLVSREALRVELPSDAPLAVTLEPAAAIVGRVLGPDGRPWADANVTATNEAGVPLGELTPGRVPPSSRSAKDGSFLLERVRAGSHRIAAAPTAARALASVPLDLTLVAGETREGIDLRLRSGGRLTGEVYDERGRPAPGHMVHLTHSSGASRFGPAGENGRFDFEHLEPGSWTVVAIDMAAAGSRPQGTGDMDAVYSTARLATVDLVEGGSEHVVLGSPDARPIRVSGTVTQSGKPRGGGWISFFPSAGGDVQRLKLAAVDKDGRYEVTLAGPGSYSASVQQIPGNDRSTIDYQREIPAGASHRIDFALPAGRIRGRVLDPKGSEAVGARVTVFSDGASHAGEYSHGHYAEVLTDDRGRFDLPALRGGKFTIAAGGPSEGECFARVVLDEVTLPDDAIHDDVVVRLPKPGAIRVHVTDAEGQPVEGAAIFVRDNHGVCIDPLSASVTDSRGRGEYGCLAPGSYTVQTRGGGLSSEECQPVIVAAGDEATVELRAVRGTQLKVELADEKGRALNGWLFVFDAQGREVGGQYNANEVEALYFAGAFSPSSPVVGPLAPGRYRVEVTAPGGVKGSHEITLAGEPEITIALTLAR